MEGNVQNMQFALGAIYLLAKEQCDVIGDYAGKVEALSQILALAHEAKSLPLRNCDVGTAEEQAQRYDKFCEGTDCVKCPVHALWHHYFEICKNKKVSCGLIWTQMPYEREVKE